MAWIKLVTAALRAMSAYCELKKEKYGHDLIREAKEVVADLEEEIENLRDIGDEPAAQRADWLRYQLIQEKTYLKRISAIYTQN